MSTSQRTSHKTRQHLTSVCPRAAHSVLCIVYNTSDKLGVKLVNNGVLAISNPNSGAPAARTAEPAHVQTHISRASHHGDVWTIIILCIVYSCRVFHVRLGGSTSGRSQQQSQNWNQRLSHQPSQKLNPNMCDTRAATLRCGASSSPGSCRVAFFSPTFTAS